METDNENYNDYGTASVNVDVPKLVRTCIFVVLAIAIGVSAAMIQNYIKSFRYIPVYLAPGTHVNVYKYASGSKTASYTSLYTLNSGERIKLRNGTTYAFTVSDPSQLYANTTTKVTVSVITNKITITKPYYSPTELTKMLTPERSAIQNTLLAAYPTLSTYYTIGNDQLYAYGNWYGAVLNPIDPTTYDTLRVVMEDSSGTWKVAAKPQMSIGEPSNPSIPLGVLTGIDRL